MMAICAALVDEEADRITFENIYHAYHKQMLHVAKRFLDSPEDAEDAVQEALLRIAKSIHRIPAGDDGRQRAYVLTVVRNAALAMLSKKNATPMHTELSEAQVDTAADPFEKLLENQDYDALLNAIQSLPMTYREVLMLRYVFDLSTKHIAELLGRKASTVKQQITRGKKMLASIHQQGRV